VVGLDIGQTNRFIIRPTLSPSAEGNREPFGQDRRITYKEVPVDVVENALDLIMALMSTDKYSDCIGKADQ